MNGTEFETRASAALGGRGWQARLSRCIGVNASTIRRWAAGELTVPAYAVALLELLERVPHTARPGRWQA
jgi:hypothetical protein